MFFKFLSKDFPVEKSFFFISKLCLGWMGEFPQTCPSKISTVSFVFHSTVLFVGVICQYWYGIYYISRDLQKGLDAICPAIACMVLFTKMVLIYWYGSDFNVVIKKLQCLLFADANEEKKKIVKDYLVRATNLSFMVFIAAAMSTIFYALRPLITNMIRVVLGMEYLFDEVPLKVMVPTVTLRLPWYPLTYAVITYVGIVTGLSLAGVGGLLIFCCLSSAALFKMLQSDIMATMDQFQYKSKLSDKENQICYRQLGSIIDRHNEVIDVTKQISSLFMWIILFHFVTASVEIGASIIEALLYPGYRAIVYATYTLGALCELYMYCYSALSIFENSTEIGTAAYFSTWYNADPRVQRMILMVIIRAQKPVSMEVPFFEPNLETFMKITQTAGSVIALVKTIL